MRKVSAKLDNPKYTKGMLPDAEDKKNIQNLIRQFEVAYPGQIDYVRKDAMQEIDQHRKLKFASLKGQKFERRLSMPQALLLELKKAYPTIITDKRQFEWFLKNFKQFDLSV